jgi:hypothetical protein
MGEVYNQQNLAGPSVTMLPHGAVVWFVDERPMTPVVGAVGVADIDGVADADGLGIGVPMIEGEMVGVGTASRGLTPALPISTDPNGIPVRETAPSDIEGPKVDDAVVSEGDPQVGALPGNVGPVPIPPPS